MARAVEDKSIMQPSLRRIGELTYIKDPCEVNNICVLGALYLLFPRKQSVSESHDRVRSTPAALLRKREITAALP